MVHGSRDAASGVEGGGPFDLSERIRAWRDRLAGAEALGPREVDELEDHLRESVDSLVGSGLSPEEAFLVATCRLGRPEEIDREFGKLDRLGVGFRRLRWMMVGYVVVAGLGILIQSLSITVASLASRLGSQGRWFLPGYVVLMALGLVAAGRVASKAARGEQPWLASLSRRTREWAATRGGKLGLYALTAAAVTALHGLRGVAQSLARTGVAPESGLFWIANVWIGLAWSYLWPLAMVAYVLHVGRRRRAGAG